MVPKNGTLAIETTPNDDNPLDTGIGYPGNIPILGIDVWEHGACPLTRLLMSALEPLTHVTFQRVI